MPSYDYECKSCGYIFEAFQNMSDAPLKTCPKCKGELRRLIGGGLGIIFKGSGFYVTDNRKSSYNSSSSPSSNSSKSDSNKNGKKPEKSSSSDKKKTASKV